MIVIASFGRADEVFRTEYHDFGSIGVDEQEEYRCPIVSGAVVIPDDGNQVSIPEFPSDRRQLV